MWLLDRRRALRRQRGRSSRRRGGGSCCRSPCSFSPSSSAIFSSDTSSTTSRRPASLSSLQEIDLLKNLNHKNIVKYLGSLKTKTHLHIILEYVENGSLANIVKPNKFGPFPESLAAVYIAQVLEGLVYLHEQGVIHRDIKGANILTTKEISGDAKAVNKVLFQVSYCFQGKPSGSLHAVEDWSLLYPLKHKSSTKNFALCLVCLADNIGKVIGKGGVIIHQIRKESGASIKVDSFAFIYTDKFLDNRGVCEVLQAGLEIMQPDMVWQV